MMTLLLGAVAAEASCQSEWCVYQRQLDDREREAAARAAYEADPDDPEALADLVSELDGVLSRERHIARFESRYTWREAPDLDALEAAVDAERRVLSARLLELRPDGTDPTRNELSIHSVRRGPSPSAPLDRPPIDRALPDLRSLRNLGERVDGELLAELEAWAAEEPEAFSPALRLALVHERQGRPDAALASWRHLLSIRPDDLDLQVAYGAFGLRLDRPEAVREAARRLLGDPEANPRHRAEGHYLLGRLAHRDGRWDEAGDHLAVYFLERLRFTGCVGIETCDRALYQLFWEAADFEAFDRYHRARAEAVAAFERRRDRLEPLPDDLPRILVERRRPEPARPWPQVFSLDCASPRALARHERRLEELRASDPYGVETARLEELLELGRTARPCTDSELPDPDTLFPDGALLGLSWDLRAVN